MEEEFQLPPVVLPVPVLVEKINTWSVRVFTFLMGALAQMIMIMMIDDFIHTPRSLPHKRNLHDELPDRIIILRQGGKDAHAQDAIVAEDFLDAPRRRDLGVVGPSGFSVRGDPDGAAGPLDGKVSGRHADFVFEVRDAVGGFEEAVDYAGPADCGAGGRDGFPFWNLCDCRFTGLLGVFPGLPVEFYAFGAVFPFWWDTSCWRRLISFDPLERERLESASRLWGC